MEARKTPHSQRSRSLQKALDVISGCMRRPLELGIYLPRVEDLAELAGVSHTSVCEAIALLKAQGILDGVRGKRTAVVSALRRSKKSILRTSSSVSWNSAGRTSRNTKERIARDILEGLYSAGKDLPTLKELGARYHVSYRPLKRAIQQLCSEGLVEVHGRGYGTAQAAVRNASARIVLIGIGFHNGGIALGGIDQDFVRNLEVDCASRNIFLQIVSFYLDEQGSPVLQSAEGVRLPQIPQAEDILGYVYLFITAASAQPELFRALERLGKPTALVDEIGGWKAPSTKSKIFRLFTVTVSPRAGETVGRLLLSLGHRSVAFFSHYHKQVWSRNRLDGLRTVYAAAGRPNGVTAWVEETHTVGRGFHDSARRLYDTTILTETYEQWKSRVPRHFAARMDSAVNNVVWGAFIDGEIYRQMDVFFTEALAQGSLTAWVCANDFIASLAADFLAHHKIRVPDDISIIGFDDSPEATRLGLTSYDFNIPGLVRSIIGCILRPSAFATYWREDRVAPEGFIVIRDSCASAAKQGRPPQAHQSAVIDSSAAATYGSIDAHDQR